MRKVAITGLTGVIGEVLALEISPKRQITDLFHNTQYSGSAKIQTHTYFDLLNRAKISAVLENVKPDIIVHMGAITHIDRCEKDKKYGKKGDVWRINVNGSYEIAKFCAKQKVPMVFLSTECVFDGKKEYFSEDAIKNPINWYGVTKDEAEELILSTGAKITIIRSVVAYHKNDFNRTIYGKILTDLKTNKNIWAVSDQLFTPTYTYDIVKAINRVIENKLLGIYHVAPKKSLSPYDFALLVASKNKYSMTRVKKTTLKSFYNPKRASLRLANACLLGEKSNKILKFVPKSPEKVL